MSSWKFGLEECEPNLQNQFCEVEEKIYGHKVMRDGYKFSSSLLRETKKSLGCNYIN